MTEREHSELYRLALDFRTARSTADTVVAWTDLERYVTEERRKVVGLLHGALTAMEVLADFAEADPLLRGALPGLPYLISETREALALPPGGQPQPDAS